MDFDEHKTKTEQALLQARRVINEANKALKRAENYFAEQGIDVDKLMDQVLQQGGPAAVREIDLMVERALREVHEEADRAVASARMQNAAPSARRKFRTLI